MAKPTRRQFLQTAVAGCVAAGILDGCAGTVPATARGPDSVAIDFEPNDPVAAGSTGQWAIGHLRQTLESRGYSVRVNGGAAADLRIAVAPGRIAGPEAYSIDSDGKTVSVQCADERGLVYALTELSDRAACGADQRTPVSEKPANRIRGIMRLFVSDVEDKKWFYDRDFWQRYLTMLAAQRFNRFNLALGLGYDAANRLRDTYFFFSYPYLLDVPGYSVRAPPLPDEERQRNLETLKFISEQTALRGMQFQLGLWTHGFIWHDSPDANYVIEGLTPEKQSDYCRDALHMLLTECPAIGGVTLRIHGESGVAEGSYDFWKSLFAAAGATGRKIEIDMHGKGMDQRMIDVALDSGLPVTISPKFWAEHMGLPYMQTAIRQQEMPTGRAGTGLMALSGGSRSFLRYSYGDLLKTGRKYSVLHRVWPGTQRLLLWGDPLFAAAYGRTFSFCGSEGVEYFDPLSFKGRQGSGLPDGGSRDGLAGPLPPLTTVRDWEKYLYTYRLLGRLAYNPDADAATLHRRPSWETAGDLQDRMLSTASRILPLITSSHCPSASNFDYWPEMYTNMSLVDSANPGSYTDTPRPRDFCHVSPLDPRIFTTVDECADELLTGKESGRYTPLDVAAKLLEWAGPVQYAGNTLYDRSAGDAIIAAGVGEFFAWKFRAAVLVRIFDRTGDPAAKREALRCYRAARDAWVQRTSRNSYLPDVTFGPAPQLRGNWKDRMAAMDRDIAAVEAHAAPAAASGQNAAAAIAAALSDQRRSPIDARHIMNIVFFAGAPLRLKLQVNDPAATARLWYRHVNQAEAYQVEEMHLQDGEFVAVIPREYTDSPFPLQYYFEIHCADGSAGLFPSLGPDFAGQPYFVVEQG